MFFDLVLDVLWFIICYIFWIQFSVLNVLTCKYYFKIIIIVVVSVRMVSLKPSFALMLYNVYDMWPFHCFCEACSSVYCACACVCQCICILENAQAVSQRLWRFLCPQDKNTVAFSGSYHIDMLKCELFPHMASLMNSRGKPALLSRRLGSLAPPVGRTGMASLWHNILAVPPKWK